MKQIISIVMLIMIVYCPDSFASDKRPGRLYLHTGILMGDESDIPDPYYDKSWYRVKFELGYDWIDHPVDVPGPLESIGLSWSIAFGTRDWEVRHGVGPKLIWRLNEDWSIETMAGPAFSRPTRHFDMGIHTSGGLIYKNRFSLDLMYEWLPVIDGDRNKTGDHISTVYGGITLRGKPGACLALTISLLFIAISIALISALANGLSGLN